MIDWKQSLMVIAISSSLVACGGGSDGGDPPPMGSSSSTDSSASSSQSSSSSSVSTATKTGVFTDSAVSGVNYETQTQSGTTNAEGEFQYIEGETVSFTIGMTTLPSAPAKETVTPLDMDDQGTGLESSTVINLLRLLQTLDDDGDPENGITIPADALADIELQVTADTFDTEASSQLETELVSEEEAVAHFEGSLRDNLTGSWVFEEDGGINVLTFLGNGEYIIAHSMADDDEQLAGSVEYSEYTWDPVGGDFSVTNVIRESDGSGGLSEQGEPATSWSASATSETLTFDIPEEGSIEFDRIQRAQGELSGSWTVPGHDTTVLTFFGDDQYVIAHTNTEETAEDADFGEVVGAAASEWGSYTWDGSTFDLTVDVDADGNDGLGNEAGAGTSELSISANGDIGYVEDPEGTGDLYRLSPLGSYTVTLRDVEGDTRTAPVKRRANAFEQDDVAGTYTFPSILGGSSGQFGMVFDEADPTSLTLASDGSGSIYSGNSVTWSLNDNGVLSFTETDDFDDQWFWTMTPIMGQSGKAMLVEITTPQGQEDSANILMITQVEGTTTRDSLRVPSPSELIGSWSYRDGEGNNIVMSFVDSGTYVISNDEDETADDNGQDGFEIGSFSINEQGAVNITEILADTNGQWGLSHPCEGETFVFQIGGDTLALGSDGDVGSTCDTAEGDVVIEFDRLQSDDPLVGTWAVPDSTPASDGYALITITPFESGYRYMHSQTGTAEGGGEPGIERGTFTHDSDNSVVFTTLTDTNAQWGFSHPCAVLSSGETEYGTNEVDCGEGGADIVQTLEVSGDTLTFTSEADTIDNGGTPQPITLERVQ